MSHSSGSSYFPPLDRCLEGGAVLISWAAAARCLHNATLEDESSSLASFLQSEEALRLLAAIQNPLSPPPTSSSQSAYQTKTAATQVSQSVDGSYSLDEIKSDALWLSGEVKIEELSALRIVILEWQQRAEEILNLARLTALTSNVDEETTKSILATSVRELPDPSADRTGQSNGLLSKFNNEDNRRNRLLRIFLEETDAIVEIHTYLITIHTTKEEQNALLLSIPGEDWKTALANDLASKVFGENDKNCEQCCRDQYVPFVRKIYEQESKGQHPKVFLTTPQRISLYGASQVNKVVSVLRILLACTASISRPLRSDFVHTWFQLMDDLTFLQNEQHLTLGAELSTINCLVSLVSLSVLRLEHTITRLAQILQSEMSGISGYSALNEDGAPFFADEKCLSTVNLVLHKAATFNITAAAPSIYAWSMITNALNALAMNEGGINDTEISPISRRDSNPLGRPAGQLGTWERRFEALQDIRLGHARGDLPRFFADAAISAMGVYGFIGALAIDCAATWSTPATFGTGSIARDILFSLIREGMTWITYGEEVLEALYAVLGSDLTGTSCPYFSRKLASRFWEDVDLLRPMILDQALLRYPYELSPLVRLLTLLAAGPIERTDAPTEIIDLLEQLSTFTIAVPTHFRGYRLESEDEGSNDMMLTETVQIFDIKPALAQRIGRKESMALTSVGEATSHGVRHVAAGTAGTIVREDPPKVLKLYHTHSGLAYLGFLLSTRLESSLFTNSAPNDRLDRDTASDIIRLFNALMAPSKAKLSWEETPRLVLYHCSSALGDEQDIVSVIAEICETELIGFVEQTAQEGSLDLCTACIEFLGTIAMVSPERVWYIISRSALLGLNNGSPALAAVVGSAEVPLRQFRFLAASTRLYNHLLEDAIAGIVRRRGHDATKRSNRFDSPVDDADSPPDHVIQSGLVGFQRIMIDAFQNLTLWRFDDSKEQSHIITSVAAAFDNLLNSAYGTKLCSAHIHKGDDVLGPAATLLLQSFTSQNGVASLLDSLTALLASRSATLENSVCSPIRQLAITETRALLQFTLTFIHTMKLTAPDSAPTACSQIIRAVMPTLAGLFATEPSLKVEVAGLLSALVDNISATNGKSVSILAPLHAEAAQAFLQVVTRLDEPWANIETENMIWKFLSTVLGGQQQWFAMYLLTGTLPRNHVNSKEKMARKRSVLQHALQQLTAIADLSPSRAHAMLEFVNRAQGVWAWATVEVRNQPNFISNAMKWLNDLRPPGRGADTGQMLRSATEYEMAALLCDILAVNLNAGLEVGDRTGLEQIRGQLVFLGNHSVYASSYNRSLHQNLAENLRAKYYGCKVTDFERTIANPAPRGDNYALDVSFADKVLSHDRAWKLVANGKGRNQGFIDEFRRANANLSLVAAQTDLAQSWRTLAAVLCNGLEQEPALQQVLIQAAETCLEANLEVNLDEPGVADSLESRAELAFMLLSSLTSIKSSRDGIKQLLIPTWDLVRSSPADFEVATNPEDLAYYRILLQILYLAIQPHIYLGPNSSSTSTRQDRPTDITQIQLLSTEIGLCLVDIVRRAIIPGFRALCGNLHNSILTAVPADFALLNGLLQAIITVQGIESVHIQLADVIANANLVRGALSLFSWADRLAESTEEDPVYGEIAITMLSTLSAMRPVAEQMAVDGALIQLSSANLADYFRKPGGKGPFDAPARMFSIWTEGFLPICLNLLDAVGPPIAAQVAAFLNSFPEQLSRAEIALQPHAPGRKSSSRQGDITLGLVAEAHSLVMLGLVLQADTARAAAEGINAADIQPFKLNLSSIQDLMESLPRSKRSLIDRIVPVNEREAAFAATTAVGSPNSLLAERVIQELHSASACFAGRSEESS